MATHLISASYNEAVKVDFTQDAWFNATAVAMAFDKRVNDWTALESTKEYLDALDDLFRNQKSRFLSVKRGGRGKSDSTWFHPKLAIPFARWLDVRFAVWCDMQIETILRNKTPQSPHQLPDPKTKQALPGGLTLEQQDTIKALVKGRVGELPKEKQAKAAVTCWSSIKTRDDLSFTRRDSSRLRMKLDAQRLYYLHDRGEFGIAFPGKRPVQTFAGQACVLGNLCHAARAGYYAQRLGDEGRVVAGFFQASVQIIGHVRLGFEVFGGIPPAQGNGLHDVLLQVARQGQRDFDVAGLTRLVAAGQQNHDFHATLDEIDAVAGAAMDAHLGNPCAHRGAVAEMADFGSVDARLNAALRLNIPQGLKPIVEHGRGKNRFHGLSVAHRPQNASLYTRFSQVYTSPCSLDASRAGFVPPESNRAKGAHLVAPFFLRSSHHIMAGLRGAIERWAGLDCPVVQTPRSPVAHSICTRTAAVASHIAIEVCHG